MVSLEVNVKKVLSLLASGDLDKSDADKLLNQFDKKELIDELISKVMSFEEDLPDRNSELDEVYS